jgi:polyhydroxyalkanoate synthesis regulator phasin
MPARRSAHQPTALHLPNLTSMSDEPPRRGTSIGEGLRAGIGILAAFKEAIEETIQDATESNSLNPDRAKEALSGALDRASDVIGDVRGRLDVVPRREFDALKAEVEELRRRVDRLDGGGGHVRFLEAGGPEGGA